MTVLFPEAERNHVVRQVALDDIVKGPVPAIKPSFFASIKANGVLEPVWLREEADKTFTIAEGRRRVAVCRELGLSHIAAFILPAIYSTAAIALMSNHQRSGNPFSDFEAIESLLMEEGASYESIASDIGIPLGTIKRILKLSKLSTPLYNLARSGKIATSVAFAAAGCSEADQDKLSKVYSETGKLTTEDIREVRKAKRIRSKAVLASLVESSDKRASGAMGYLRNAAALLDDAGLFEKAGRVRMILNEG